MSPTFKVCNILHTRETHLSPILPADSPLECVVHVLVAEYLYSRGHPPSNKEPRSRRGVLDTTLWDKIVSDFRQVGSFLRFPPPIKLTVTIELKYC